MWSRQIFVAVLCTCLAWQQVTAVVNNNPLKDESSKSTPETTNPNQSSATIEVVADSVGVATEEKGNRREVAISDTYGAPPVIIAVPADSYLPAEPSNPNLPVPVYGVPDTSSNNVVYPEPPPDIPPPKSLPSPAYGLPLINSYGPPLKVNFALANGNFFGPPLNTYGPPNNNYGPPNNNYRPPTRPFSGRKPVYSPPRFQYGPPGKPVNNIKFGFKPPYKNFGPKYPSKPFATYGPPVGYFKDNYSPIKFNTNFNAGNILSHGGSFGGGINTKYGTPNLATNLDLSGANGISNQYVVPDFGFSSHGSGNLISTEYGTPDNDILGSPKPQYGPPQPSPHPRPPHPGAPAPPTPPDIKYDGWQPIPGLVSRKPTTNYGAPNVEQHVENDLSYNKDLSPPPLDTHNEQQPNIHASLANIELENSYGSVAQKGISDSYRAPLNTVTGSGGVISASGEEAHANHDHSHDHQSNFNTGLSALGLNGQSINTVKSVGYEIFPNGAAAISGQQSSAYGSSGSSAQSSGSYDAQTIQGQLSGSYGSPTNSLQPSSSYGTPTSSGQLSGSYGAPTSSGQLSGSYGAPTSSGQLSGSYGAPTSSGQLSGSYGAPTSSGQLSGAYGAPTSLGQLSGSHGAPTSLGQLSGSHGAPTSSGQLSGSYGAPTISLQPSKSYGAPTGSGQPSGSYGAPLQSSNSYATTNLYTGTSFGSSHKHGSFNSQKSHGYKGLSLSTSGIGLIPPSGVYGAPSGSYGTPLFSRPKPGPSKYHIPPPPSNLYESPNGHSAVSFQNINHGSASGYSSYNAPLNIVDGQYNQGQVGRTHGVNDIISLDYTHPGLTLDFTQGYSTPHDCKQQSLPSLSYGVPSANSYTAALSSLTTNIGHSGASISSTYGAPEPLPLPQAQIGLEPKPHDTYGIPDLAVSHSQKVSTEIKANSIESQSLDVQGKAYGKTVAASFGPNSELVQSDSIDFNNIPLQGALGSYTLQIQSADGGQSPTPHGQVLNDGLLQSILAAIEQPKGPNTGQPIIQLQQSLEQQQFVTNDTISSVVEQLTDDEIRHGTQLAKDEIVKSSQLAEEIIQLPSVKEIDTGDSDIHYSSPNQYIITATDTVQNPSETSDIETNDLTPVESEIPILENNGIALYFSNTQRLKKETEGESNLGVQKVELKSEQDKE